LASFTYTQGSHEVDPPAGWEDYFGARPLYRFLDTRHGDNFENLRRLRHMPYSVNAEDAIRMLKEFGESEQWHQQVWRDAIDDVFKTLDEHPDVNAFIGYSEGAMVGASLIVEEAMRAKQTGRQPRIQVRKRTPPRVPGHGWQKNRLRLTCSPVCHLHLRLAAHQVRG
jgi:hypothetical protein